MLKFGPISPTAVHLCVDMQRLFREDTPWRTPWMEKVLPRVVALARARAAATIFTRFIPAAHPGEGVGVWARYWTKWADLTLERLQPGLVELIPDLAALSPPALTIDKHVYSPWVGTQLHEILQTRHCDTLVVTGGETDVCVLASVLGAIDRGYRIIVVADGICSSSDGTHDAALQVYAERYAEHVETVSMEIVLAGWA